MTNILKVCLLITVLIFAGCKKDEVEKPKVIYKTPTKTNPAPKIDTTQVLIADLPIQMPGTNYLIHPIATMNVVGNRYKPSYGSSDGNEISFRISNYSEYEITGYLQNLKFQEISSDSIKALTDKPVLIQTVTYLKSVFDKTKQQVLIYTLVDTDTNMDGKLDENDIKSLYISNISGANFTKLSNEFQELIDWNLIESKNSLYFRTIEDTNKNGKFDKNDIIHYHIANLSNKDWKVLDYSPI